MSGPAYEAILETISLPSIVGFASTSQYLFCRLVTGGVTNCNTTQSPLGVLQDYGTTGQVVEIAVGGVSKVKLNGTVFAGQALGMDGTGKAVKWATGQFMVGTTLSDGVVGDIVPVLLAQIPFIPPSAIT